MAIAARLEREALTEHYRLGLFERIRFSIVRLIVQLMSASHGEDPEAHEKLPD